MGIKKNLVKNQQSGGKKSKIYINENPHTHIRNNKINNNNNMKGTLYVKKKTNKCVWDLIKSILKESKNIECRRKYLMKGLKVKKKYDTK